MDILQLSQLGKWGRAGNAIIQYIWGRTYARRHNLQLQCPHWFGAEIWGFDDPPIDRYLPRVEEKMFHGIDDTIIPHLAEPLRNWDAVGYFQYHTSYYRPDREFIQSIFARPRDKWLARVSDAAAALKGIAPRRIGVHVRRGDFGTPGTMFHNTPIEWYLPLLEAISENAVLLVASDDPEAGKLFARFNAVTAADLGVETSREILSGCAHLNEDIAAQNYHALDFFPDWWLLGQCDTLVIPNNSTFSFSAGMASPLCKQAYRSNPDIRGFAAIDLWDAFPSQMIDVAKYADIPGLYNQA